jgi:hypothetical protein
MDRFRIARTSHSGIGSAGRAHTTGFMKSTDDVTVRICNLLRNLRRSALFAPTFALCALAEVAAGQNSPHARADNQPVWGSDLRVVEELRIGAVQGPGHLLFGDIPPAGVAVQADGELWIADRQAIEVRRFDQNGRYLGSIGRRGNGPGEFQSIDGIDRLDESRTVVWDGSLRRVSIFHADGSFAHMFRPMVALWSPTVRSIFVDSLQRIWLLDTGRVSRGDYHWRRFDESGANLDSLPIPAPARSGPQLARQDYGYSAIQGFAREMLSTPLFPGKLLVGRNEDYALSVFEGSEVALEIRRSWTPVRVLPAERRSFQAVEETLAERRGVRPGTVPSEKPAFWQLRGDRDSRIWVAVHRAGRSIDRDAPELRREGSAPRIDWWEPLTFEVLSSTGQFLGRVELPNPRSDLVYARAARIWVVERGSYDEQYVVRYRIEQRQRGTP